MPTDVLHDLQNVSNRPIKLLKLMYQEQSDDRPTTLHSKVAYAKDFNLLNYSTRTGIALNALNINNEFLIIHIHVWPKHAKTCKRGHKLKKNTLILWDLIKKKRCDVKLLDSSS